MLRGIYSAATALDVAQQNHDVIAENLANATVPGYRRRGLSFETFQQELDGASATQPAASTHGTRTAREYTGWEGGPLQQTGNPFDLAIGGDGFFVLQGPNGPLYTRNGTFQVDANGELRSHEGLPVNSAGGGITIPPNVASVTVGRDGTVMAGKLPIGQIQVKSFADRNQLQRVGTTLFAAPPGVEPQAGSSSVLQGYRESSNVQVVNEMVLMISGMRHFEAAQHALRALSETQQLSTRPQGS